MRGKHVHVYKDSKSRNYEDTVASILASHKPVAAPQGTAVYLDLTFYLPRPKAHYGAKGLKPRYALADYTGKPDLDNLVKALKDSAKGLLWHDDSQVVRIRAVKFYANEEVGTAIEVEWNHEIRNDK
jgi:Holliday junction resolvase RusA-like endonuclease